MRTNQIPSDFIYGKNPVIEALQNGGVTVEKVLIQNNLRGELEKEVRALCKAQEVPMSKVPLEKLNKLANRQNHQGVAAFISPITFTSLEDVISLDFELGKNPLILILENVTDVRNVGAIARSAHVFGASALVFPMKHAARINEDAIKISSGALLKIPVCREKNMLKITEICKSFGLKMIATDLHTDSFVDDLSYHGPLALVMGSEDQGITEETRRMVDHTVKIKQPNDFDSLNVSVATGVLLYEISRSRLK